jgi:hypothetical protein
MIFKKININLLWNSTGVNFGMSGVRELVCIGRSLASALASYATH